ncbi:hypothetical protein C8Q79DRAFT_149600 [Trametes meyenii]|nr:hypothetical protein C8Q79DRAFT_149600 [Trametes meyenii]
MAVGISGLGSRHPGDRPAGGGVMDGEWAGSEGGGVDGADEGVDRGGCRGRRRRGARRAEDGHRPFESVWGAGVSLHTAVPLPIADTCKPLSRPRMARPPTVLARSPAVVPARIPTAADVRQHRVRRRRRPMRQFDETINEKLSTRRPRDERRSSQRAGDTVARMLLEWWSRTQAMICCVAENARSRGKTDLSTGSISQISSLLQPIETWSRRHVHELPGPRL